MCVCVLCTALELEWGTQKLLRSCDRKAELLSPFQSYWERGWDCKNPSPHRMPVSHTDPSPSCSVGNFPRLGKRTVKRGCHHGRRVFTIATQRTVEALSYPHNFTHSTSFILQHHGEWHLFGYHPWGARFPSDSTPDSGHLEKGQAYVFHPQCKQL